MFNLLAVRCCGLGWSPAEGRRRVRQAGGGGRAPAPRAAAQALAACRASAGALVPLPPARPTSIHTPSHTSPAQNGTFDALVLKRPTAEFFTFPYCALTIVPGVEFDVVRSIGGVQLYCIVVRGVHRCHLIAFNSAGRRCAKGQQKCALTVLPLVPLTCRAPARLPSLTHHSATRPLLSPPASPTGMRGTPSTPSSPTSRARVRRGAAAACPPNACTVPRMPCSPNRTAAGRGPALANALAAHPGLLPSPPTHPPTPSGTVEALINQFIRPAAADCVGYSSDSAGSAVHFSQVRAGRGCPRPCSHVLRGAASHAHQVLLLSRPGPAAPIRSSPPPRTPCSWRGCGSSTPLRSAWRWCAAACTTG